MPSPNCDLQAYLSELTNDSPYLGIYVNPNDPLNDYVVGHNSFDYNYRVYIGSFKELCFGNQLSNELMSTILHESYGKPNGWFDYNNKRVAINVSAIKRLWGNSNSQPNKLNLDAHFRASMYSAMERLRREWAAHDADIFCRETLPRILDKANTMEKQNELKSA